MQPNPPTLANSCLRACKGTRSKQIISKQRVLNAMNSRRPATSLEPFLGTYRIVWDSESNFDPRDVLFDGAQGDRDPCDGLLILTRPQRAQAWPKERPPSSNVVLRLCDSFLGTDRTASQLKPSPRPTPISESSSSSDMRSARAASPPSPFSTCLESNSSLRSSLSSASSSTTSSSSTTDVSRADHTRRFWRFDWDPSFPRLGFRFEGMDLTAPRGHALSFSHIRDDRGHPFAVVDLRPTGWGGGADELGERVSLGGGAESESYLGRKRDSGGGDGEPACYITVVAKRVVDQYSREGLSEAERERLGMVELDDLLGVRM
ncbi:hypothetical protein BD414DRAFT_535539 [Trametes punicea]|nr:hypothetical protein BD414DRAFT_535539 [Trametes punicea]